MDHDDAKHIAGFVGIMAVGLGCMYLFVKLMSIAAYLDRG